MGYAIYKVGKRWGGYDVPARCEFPRCGKYIDRGISYACGGEPFSEMGCDRYFCHKHKRYTRFDENGERCKHEEEEKCECEYVELCERCRDGKPEFPYKPELKRWLKHILTDESWQDWRDENEDEVENYKQIIKTKKEE